MILPDANLLLYAYDERAPEHEKARRWLQGILSASQPVLLCWPVMAAFLRISTDPRLQSTPFQMGEAIAIVQEWLERRCVQAISPGPGHWKLLQKVIAEGQARGPLVSDAQLAALALEHGARLASADRDFARFPSLDWYNPLAT